MKFNFIIRYCEFEEFILLFTCPLMPFEKQFGLSQWQLQHKLKNSCKKPTHANALSMGIQTSRLFSDSPVQIGHIEYILKYF